MPLLMYFAAMPYYVVSACLAGQYCRYDAGTSPCAFVCDLVKNNQALPLCPEQLGGLPTPRNACEMQGQSVFDAKGQEHTAAFIQGAQYALALAKAHGCTAAILKTRSPSCGRDAIYDGTFSKKLIAGRGIWAALLAEADFSLYTEEDLPFHE